MNKHCKNCKYDNVPEKSFPCVHCFRNTYDKMDKWEPKEKEQ